MTARTPRSPSSWLDTYPQRDFRIRERAAKSPLFARDVEVMGAAYTAPIERLRAWAPGERPEPLEVLPGRGVAWVHCLRYGWTDVGPYQEVSLSAMVGPARTTAAALARAFASGTLHVRIQELPVSTEIALWGGIDVFNYPKVLARIEQKTGAFLRTCEIRDTGTDALILTARAPRLPRAPLGHLAPTLTLVTHGRKDGAAIRARMLLRPARLSIAPGPLGFTLDTARDHPRARAFADLDRWPLFSFQADDAEAILFEPEPDTEEMLE